MTEQSETIELDDHEDYPPVGTPETALVYSLGEDNYTVVAHTGRYLHGAINCAGFNGEEIGFQDVPEDPGIWVFENGTVVSWHDADSGHVEVSGIEGDWRKARPADFRDFGVPCPLDLD